MSLLQGSPAGPIWREMPISRAFSTYPPGSPAREPFLQASLHKAPIVRDASPQDDTLLENKRKVQ